MSNLAIVGIGEVPTALLPERGRKMGDACDFGQ